MVTTLKWLIPLSLWLIHSSSIWNWKKKCMLKKKKWTRSKQVNRYIKWFNYNEVCDAQLPNNFSVWMHIYFGPNLFLEFWMLKYYIVTHKWGKWFRDNTAPIFVCFWNLIIFRNSGNSSDCCYCRRRRKLRWNDCGKASTSKQHQCLVSTK